MKKYQSINIIVVLLFVSIFTAQAQEERNQGIIRSYLHGWEYGIKAGFSIGGTTPLPLPKEIRKIDSMRQESQFQLKVMRLSGSIPNGG